MVCCSPRKAASGSRAWPRPETKELVSYLPDADWLPDWMRVEELVEMFRDFYGTPSQAKAYIGFDADQGQ